MFADPKIKLQSRAIANDIYKSVMDLVTNGSIVSDALDYVNNKTKELSSAAENKLLREGESEESKEPDYDEDKDQLEETGRGNRRKENNN